MTTRVRSIDVLRGVVMVLMAVDHVRVYSGVPAGGPEPAIFFTRWITHFCAPAFVFLSGTSAWFASQKRGTAGLTRFLVTRGLFLIVLELTIVKFFWTFGLDYRQFVLFGVIWMLGWSMVLLAGMVRLDVRVIGAVGLLVMLGHPLLQSLPERWWWEFIYTRWLETPQPVVVLYSILPWAGVMAAGYAFGAVIADEQSRRTWPLRLGLAATLAFVLIATIRGINAGPDDLPPLLHGLSHSKYPPSLPFLLMTLGPTIALMPWADRAAGRVATWLSTLGRVPMFYYLCHIPLIHLMALVIWWMARGGADTAWFATAPYVEIPDSERWPLSWLYLSTFAVVVLLYPLCRWFEGIRAGRPNGMLRFL